MYGESLSRLSHLLLCEICVAISLFFFFKEKKIYYFISMFQETNSPMRAQAHDYTHRKIDKINNKQTLTLVVNMAG